VNLGNRSRHAVLVAPFQPAHYRALAGMVARYPDLAENARRYLTGTGAYPYTCRVRTPLGLVAPTLYSSHDISTVNEVFCRGDYRVGGDFRVAVDVGANIGVSALYFLTRNTTARAYLYEPDPRNVERLRRNLERFEARYELEQVAIGTADGDARFRTEPTGRYGRLVRAGGDDRRDEITVAVRSINAILADVLRREEGIDILKIDVEGLETEIVAAIDPKHLDRIDVVVFETDHPTPLHTDRYRHSFATQTNRLTALPRQGVAGASDV